MLVESTPSPTILHISSDRSDGKDDASQIPTNIDLKNLCAPAPLPGDHSVCEPPDPFSNSAVKPVRANGTNAQALEE